MRVQGETLFFCCCFLIPIAAEAQQSAVQKAISEFENYLNMAGSRTAADFQPLTQRERTDLYLRGLTNPWGFAKAAMSAGLDQWHDKPQEWGQGWGPYGQRVARSLERTQARATNDQTESRDQFLVI